MMVAGPGFEPGTTVPQFVRFACQGTPRRFWICDYGFSIVDLGMIWILVMCEVRVPMENPKSQFGNQDSLHKCGKQLCVLASVTLL